MTKTLFFLVLFFLLAPVFGQDYAATLLGKSKGTLIYTSYDALSALIRLGELENDNIIEVFHKASQQLVLQGKRVVITGEIYRKLHESHRLGGVRIDALLPPEKIQTISFGATSPENLHALEIQLLEKHSQSLEGANFELEMTYGFKSLGPTSLEEAFGMKVSQFYFTAVAQKIVMEPKLPDARVIAIYFVGFDTPKRWNLVRVKKNK